MNGRAALSLFCLAPRGVCRAVRLPGFAVGSYSTISPLPVPCGHRRYLSAALIRPGSSRYPSLTFMRRVALWCPDFPHLHLRETATVRGAARAPWGSPFDFPIKMSSGWKGDRNAEARRAEREDRGGGRRMRVLLRASAFRFLHFPIQNTSRKNHAIMSRPTTILKPMPAIVPTTDPTPEMAA